MIGTHILYVEIKQCQGFLQFTKQCSIYLDERLTLLFIYPSYQEFLSFLEKGQEEALKICPDLKDLSETEKKQTPIEPNILDELSSRTKSTLMSKLMKKV